MAAGKKEEMKVEEIGRVLVLFASIALMEGSLEVEHVDRKHHLKQDGLRLKDNARKQRIREAATGSPFECKREQNKKYWGWDIETIHDVASTDDCQKECATRLECKGYTYHLQTKECVPKRELRRGGYFYKMVSGTCASGNNGLCPTGDQDRCLPGLTIKYSASSVWSSSYDAGHAIAGEGQYWCSDGGDKAPLYWWISFVEKPVEIVSISLEEKYPAAVFEFFGSSTDECARTGPVLIRGARAEINHKTFENGRYYHCYGLRITKLGDGGKYGDLASLTKFRFSGKEENIRLCRSVRANCEYYVNFDRCDRNGLGLQFRDEDYEHNNKWKRRCCDRPLEKENCWQTVSAFRKEKPRRCLEEDSDETRRYWDQWFGDDVLRWIATPLSNHSVVVCEDPDMVTKYCLNGGTCMQTKLSSHIMCFCTKEWMGKRCETRFIDLPGTGSKHANHGINMNNHNQASEKLLLQLAVNDEKKNIRQNDVKAEGLTIKYSASSVWSSSYDAGHAIAGEGQYWCSDCGDKPPLYWWISFVEKPVEIFSISLEEKYPAAVFEFFGSSTDECATTGPVLIRGARAEINNKTFKNGRYYYCYGLRITKLGDGGKYGDLASLTKFRFSASAQIIGSPCDCMSHYKKCEIVLRKAKEEKWPLDQYFLPRLAFSCCDARSQNQKHCRKAKMKFDELSPASCFDYQKYLPEDDEVARHN